MQIYRAARTNYEDAVAKYNRNVAANANLQGMMNGTVGRAQTQLGIMRQSLGNMLREHGKYLPPEMYLEASRLYAGIPSSPF